MAKALHFLHLYIFLGIKKLLSINSQNPIRVFLRVKFVIGNNDFHLSSFGQRSKTQLIVIVISSKYYSLMIQAILHQLEDVLPIGCFRALSLSPRKSHTCLSVSSTQR